ncbi:ABC1 kinase family protein [Ornithinimicrobium sp. W1665]|uniref:ABC1 kinase family protein n=1 Tax=Ornithinimicrobium sp. W1665 TaxID=3416666 RepID=UPI003CF156D5
MTPVLTAIGFAFNTALLFVLTRRLLGVPVGWFRTLLVAIVVTGAMSGFLELASERLGITSDGGLAEPSDDLTVVALVLLLLVAWGVALGVGGLVLLEALVPTGTLPSPVAVLRDLPARRRRSRRYGQIVAVAVKHGLGGFLRAGSRLPEDHDHARLGRRLRMAFSDGGVTFVKLGQMLATRPDVVGPDLAAELGQLQADTPPQAWPDIERTLRAELGEGWRDEFAAFDEEPLAAASVGQVYRADLADGSPVVVKVQRAGAQEQVRADLDIVLRMSRWLERTTPWGRALGVRNLAEGFAASLTEELDYRVEAANAAAVAAGTGPSAGAPVGTGPQARSREDAGADALVRVPTTYPSLTTSRVLVMERVAGVPLSRADATRGLDATTRERLAHALLGSVLTQVLQTGVFHADLHAGNVLVERVGRPAGDDGADGADGADRPGGEGGNDDATGPARLALLDYGSVGRLDRTARDAVGRLLFAVDRGDSLGAVDSLCDVIDAPAGLDDRALEREVGAVISRVQNGSAGPTTSVFGDLFVLVVRHGFTVPPQIAAAFRALGALEGTLQALHPELDLVTASRSAGQDYLGQKLSPQEVRATLEEHLVHVLPILQRLPRRVDAIAAAVQSGEAQLRVRWLADPSDRSFVTGVVNHLVITVLASVLALSGVLLLVAPGGPALPPTIDLNPLLGGTLFLFAFVLGARSLARVFRDPGPSPRRGR